MEAHASVIQTSLNCSVELQRYRVRVIDPEVLGNRLCTALSLGDLQGSTIPRVGISKMK